jgi:hypothetical protein
MRTTFVLALVVVLIGGCGGDDDRQVSSLSAADQEAVCADFVVTICAQPQFADFCTACVTTTGCATAATSGAITTECGGDAMATVAMVEACAEAGEITVCLEGGGCMFDAVEVACPR